MDLYTGGAAGCTGERRPYALVNESYRMDLLALIQEPTEWNGNKG